MQTTEFSKQVFDRLSEDERATLFNLWEKPEPTALADARLTRGESISLKIAREALLVSSDVLAKRLGLSSNAYILLERRAQSGKASMASLQRAADALGCELVIQVRPKGRFTFARRLWIPLLNESLETESFKNLPNHRLALALRRRLHDLVFDSEFRRAQEWTRLHKQGRRRWYH